MCNSPQFAHTASGFERNASWARLRLRRPLECLRLGSGVTLLSSLFLTSYNSQNKNNCQDYKGGANTLSS